jgi:predicted metal-dependent HD superfamily phosphohydrolase
METELIQKSRLFAEKAFEKLPKEYVYHNFDHTTKVVQAAEEIGRATHLSDEELETVMVAAWLHDVGFVKGCSNHELQSALDAEKVLTDAGASPEKIQQVKQAIEATRMPQQPRNLVEQVLCDADLYHLSNGNLEEAAQRLQRELSVTQNMHLSQDQWNEHHLAFLKQHEYFTPYGREVLQERKRKNVKKLKKMMKQGATPIM